MVAPVDRRAAARAIEDFLRALGHEPTGQFAQTPELVAAAWCDELIAGEARDAAAMLREGAIPCEPTTDFVALHGLEAATICPHHLLPSHGDASVVYLPGARVAGFGAIARALEACTRRLVLQEDAGRHLARLLVDELGARGAMVRMRLVHTCLAIRGAAQPGARVETLAFAGSFASDGDDRRGALALLASSANEGQP
jgi:GTP cyclohydrolase I